MSDKEINTSIEVKIKIMIPEQIKSEDIENYVKNKVVLECYQLPESEGGVMGFRELDIELISSKVFEA